MPSVPCQASHKNDNGILLLIYEGILTPTQYGLDHEEFEEHMICMAAPIFNPWNSVVAALSVSFPAFRFDPARQDEYAALVIAAGRAVSLELGCPSYPLDQE